MVWLDGGSLTPGSIFESLTGESGREMLVLGSEGLVVDSRDVGDQTGYNV